MIIMMIYLLEMVFQFVTLNSQRLMDKSMVIHNGYLINGFYNGIYPERQPVQWS